MRFHEDDRGTRYCDVFPEIGKGDINITVVKPGAVALWHRHKLQVDHQFVVKGALKIGVCNCPNIGNVFNRDCQDALVEEWHSMKSGLYESDPLTWTPEYIATWDQPAVCWHILSDRNANMGPLKIPKGLWHGCYNFTNEEAILIYHITNKYDGKDEDRCPPYVMNWPYEREIK
jgi:hypothetical protein